MKCCQLTNFFRARLLLGLYHRLSKPKWQQYITKLYCLLVSVLFITVAILINEFSVYNNAYFDFWLWAARARYIQYIINNITSLWTEQPFVFCTMSKFTDITLDSASIFFKFEKKCQVLTLTLFIYKIIIILVYNVLRCNVFSIVGAMSHIYLQSYLLLNFLNQYLVLGVLRSRLQVLRVRLTRHGFRRARDCALGINVYCDMHNETLESFKKIENQLKTLITVDLIAETVCFICVTSSVITMTTSNLTEDLMKYIGLILASLDIAAPLYLICYEMEMVAEQVGAIREIAVTELLKNPSARERRAILELVAVTEAAPAQLRLNRAVQVNARLLLAAVGSCTGRVLLILQITQK